MKETQNINTRIISSENLDTQEKTNGQKNVIGPMTSTILRAALNGKRSSNDREDSDLEEMEKTVKRAATDINEMKKNGYNSVYDGYTNNPLQNEPWKNSIRFSLMLAYSGMLTDEEKKMPPSERAEIATSRVEAAIITIENMRDNKIESLMQQPMGEFTAEDVESLEQPIGKFTASEFEKLNNKANSHYK